MDFLQIDFAPVSIGLQVANPALQISAPDDRFAFALALPLSLLVHGVERFEKPVEHRDLSAPSGRQRRASGGLSLDRLRAC